MATGPVSPLQTSPLVTIASNMSPDTSKNREAIQREGNENSEDEDYEVVYTPPKVTYKYSQNQNGVFECTLPAKIDPEFLEKVFTKERRDAVEARRMQVKQLNQGSKDTKQSKLAELQAKLQLFVEEDIKNAFTTLALGSDIPLTLELAQKNYEHYGREYRSTTVGGDSKKPTEFNKLFEAMKTLRFYDKYGCLVQIPKSSSKKTSDLMRKSDYES